MGDKKGKKTAKRVDPEVELTVEEQLRRNAAKEELDFARSLYETEAVKRESKKAFSKISMLLIRYNRLQEVKRRQREEGERLEKEEMASYEKKVQDIKAFYENSPISKDMTDEQAKKLFGEQEADIKAAELAHNAAMEKARNIKEYMGPELLDSLNKDTGGIRGALMLGGNTAFGKGYTMTDGSFADVQKAGMYVDDVGSGKGTLMEQMSLLDNAVNTGGMDLDAGQKKEGVAHQNLSEIFRSITDDEVKMLNTGGMPLDLNMDMIKKTREDKSMDKLIGKKKVKKTVNAAAEERGVVHLVEKKKIGGLKLKQIGLTQEAVDRKSGKKAGSVAKSRIPAMSLYEKKNYTSFNNTGLGSLWSIGQRRMKIQSDNAEERRRRVRAARLQFNKEVDEYKAEYRAKRFTEVNKNDKLDDEMKMFKADEIRSKEELVKAGILDEAELDKVKAMDDVAMMQERLKSAKKNDSAGHMLAAYKMMGASTQELLDFRLALIAYMVPIGKNTIGGIVKESHAIGVVGGEGDAEYDDYPDKKKYFALLQKKADYVERKKEDESVTKKYKWAVDKKVSGDEEEVPEVKPGNDGKVEPPKKEDKKEDKKEEPPKNEDKKEEQDDKDKKKPTYLTASDSMFITASEENRASLFGDQISIDDVKQGDAKNSWLMAPLAALVLSDPDYIKKELVKPNGDLAAKVKLYDKDGNPVNVLVSKSAVDSGSNESALWVRVVEKAALALLGSTQKKEEGSKIDMTAFDGGNTDLGMTMLLGKELNKKIDIPKENADAKKDEILQAVRDAKGQKKILTASIADGPEAELKQLGLRLSQDYTIIGEGKEKDGEVTLKLRDTHGVAETKTVKTIKKQGKDGIAGAATVNVKLEKIQDGILEIKISDFLKYFSSINLSGTARDGKDKDAELPKQELKQDEKKDELPKVPVKKEEEQKDEKDDKQGDKQDVKKKDPVTLGSFLKDKGAEGGEALIRKWQSLGDALWEAAYVDMGKEYLEQLLKPVDELLCELVDEIKDKTDKKALSTKYQKIVKLYREIMNIGVELANDLPKERFDNNDKAAAAALALSNNAIAEGAKFSIGGSTLIKDPQAAESLKQSNLWISMVLIADDLTAELRKKKTEKKKEEDKKEEKDKKDEKEEKEDLEDVDLAVLMDPDVVKIEQDDEEPDKKEPAANQDVTAEPADEEGYVKRWTNMSSRLMQLTDGKFKHAELMFLLDFSFKQAAELSNNVPVSKVRKKVIIDSKNPVIKNNYIEICEHGRQLAAALAKEKFEGAGEAKKMAESMVRVAARELDAFEKGRGKLNEQEDKAHMIWARALMLGKEVKPDAEKLPEKDKEKDKTSFDEDVVVIEKGPDDYVKFWEVLENKLRNSVDAKFRRKHIKMGNIFQDYDRVLKSAGIVKAILAAPVSNPQNAKDFTQKTTQLKFYYQYIHRVGGLLSKVMSHEDMNNTTAAAILKQMSQLANRELYYLLVGTREAVKGNGEAVNKYAGYLVNGRKVYDAWKAKNEAKKQEGEKDKVPPVAGGKNDAPKNDPKKQVIAGQPKVEIDGGDKENDGPDGELKLNDGEKPEGEHKVVIPKDDAHKDDAHKDDAHKEDDPKDKEEKKLDEELKKISDQIEQEHEGDDDEDDLDEEVKADVEMAKRDKRIFDRKYSKDMKAINKFLGIKEEEDEQEHEEKKEKKRGRRNTIGGLAGKKEPEVKEGRKRRLSVDLTHQADPDKLLPVKKADAGKEMKALNEGAKRVGDQSFTPITRGEKVKNRIVSAAKYLWGTAMLPVNLTVAGITKLMLINKKKNRPKDVQNDRKQKPTIKGRGDKSLEEKEVPKDEEGNEQVYDDTRNVPLVWEFMTAGDPEEAPEMSINMEQPDPGKSKVSNWMESGHGFISLSYSRFNVSTKRKERYQVDYGFHPKDEFGGFGMSMNLAMNAFVPGTLKDNRENPYSISKRYTIDNKKVNDVLKASEKYAQGGYNVFNRNCVTFTVEMGKIAGLPIADQIKESEYDMGTLMRIGSVFGGGFAPSSRYTAEMQMEDTLGRKDMNYQTFGQKVTTIEELKHYKNTRELIPHTPKGYSPGAAGHAILNVKDVTGGFGSRGVLELEADADNTNDRLHQLAEMGSGLAKSIAGKFAEVTRTETKKENADKKEGEEAYKPVMNLIGSAEWNDLKKYKFDDVGADEKTADTVREMRKKIDDGRKSLSVFISKNPKYLKNCMDETMQLLSIYENTLRILDESYQKIVTHAYKGDLKSMRETYTKSAMIFKYTDAKGDAHDVELEPSLIEAYLQIFGSMKEAAPQMARYCEYRDKMESADITDKEKIRIDRESEEVKSYYELAKQFSDSHRYFFNKVSYNKEDFEYAFKILPEMEKPDKDDKMTGPMTSMNTSPSAMLQSLVFETAFRGFTDGIADVRDKKSEDEIAGWIHGNLMKCANSQGNAGELKRILTFFREGSKDDKETCDKFLNTLNNSFVTNALLVQIDDVEALFRAIPKLRTLEDKEDGLKKILMDLLKNIPEEKDENG